MQIRIATKWIVEEFSEADAQALRRLGWEWQNGGSEPLTPFGHFYTYDRDLVNKTVATVKNVPAITDLARAK